MYISVAHPLLPLQVMILYFRYVDIDLHSEEVQANVYKWEVCACVESVQWHWIQVFSNVGRNYNNEITLTLQPWSAIALHSYLWLQKELCYGKNGHFIRTNTLCYYLHSSTLKTMELQWEDFIVTCILITHYSQHSVLLSSPVWNFMILLAKLYTDII